jgi:hypothetical protein
MDRDKVKVIATVRIFHGLVHFYNKFIRIFSVICAPPTHYLKRKDFKWTTMVQRSFEFFNQRPMPTFPILVKSSRCVAMQMEL